ncbi:MAG TPA: peptidoglycan-binding protein [Longimicrobium sp.]|jgi:hypothetical protein
MASRLLFERAPSGFRTVQGGVVEDLQGALVAAGFDVQGVDGVFGGNTETALQAWQRSRGLVPTGRVDVDAWTGLTNRPPPPTFERSLQLTADFEGHGFTLVVGNFDGAGLTWGIIGFTLLTGDLGPVLREIRRDHPAVFSAAFGPLEPELVRVLGAPAAEQRRFADSISLPPNRRRVRPEWKEAFARLGRAPQARAVQLRHAEGRWRRALDEMERFGLRSELGAALCYDVVVQNGGFEADEVARIRRGMQASPGAPERAVRELIASVVAEGSRPQFVEDVRRRKLTIATGTGSVHGARYRLGGWGLDELPA